MKTFFKINIILIFSLLSVLFLILLFIRLDGVSIEKIKADLAGANIYTQAVTELNAQIDNTLTNDNSDQASVLIAQMIKKEITPDYLQGKTEKFIDDTNEWMIGKNPNPTVISFQDLKEKMTAQNAEIITTLETFNKEYEKQKKEIKKEVEINEEIPRNQEIPSFNLNKIIKSDFTISLDNKLDFLKTFYWYIVTLFPVIGTILIILLIIIIFLNDNNSAKLKWLGLTLLSSAIWNILLMLTLLLFSKSMTAFLLKNNDIPSFLVSVFNSLIPPLVDKYIKFLETAIGIFIFIFIICLIASFIFKKNKDKLYLNK